MSATNVLRIFQLARDSLSSKEEEKDFQTYINGAMCAHISGNAMHEITKDAVAYAKAISKEAEENAREKV